MPRSQADRTESADMTRVSLNLPSVIASDHNDLIMSDSDDDTSFTSRLSCIENTAPETDLAMPESDTNRDADRDTATDGSVTDEHSEYEGNGLDTESKMNATVTNRKTTLLKVDICAEGGTDNGRISHDQQSAEGFAEDLVMPDSDEAASPSSERFGSDIVIADADISTGTVSAHFGKELANTDLIMPDSDTDHSVCVRGIRKRPTVHFALSADLVMMESDDNSDLDNPPRNGLHVNESDSNDLPEIQFRDIENMSVGKSPVLVINCNLYCTT